MQKLHQHLSLSDFNAAVAPVALANACFPMQDKQQNQSPGGNEQTSEKTNHHHHEALQLKVTYKVRLQF